MQWLGDNYTSDIDHTGSLSEAIVTLPKEVAPAATVTLDVQYGGTITPDATRLTRMGAPADVAARNDWDEISDPFTAVRGLGYVAWYPVAIEAVSLSDGNAVFDAIARWKHRHDRSEFDAAFAIEAGDGKQPLRIVTNMSDSGEGKLVPEVHDGKTSYLLVAKTSLVGLGETVPTFAVANYVELARPTVTLLHIGDDTSLARDYVLAAEANDPLLRDWLGESTQPARVIELTDPNANPWQNGSVLFTPLREAPTSTLQLLLLPAQVGGVVPLSARLDSGWDGTIPANRRGRAPQRTTCSLGVSRPISRAPGASRASSASESGSCDEVLARQQCRQQHSPQHE